MGDGLHLLARHVHPIGELTHQFVGELLVEGLDGLLEAGSILREAFEYVAAGQNGAVVVGEEVLVIVQKSQIGPFVQAGRFCFSADNEREALEELELTA